MKKLKVGQSKVIAKTVLPKLKISNDVDKVGLWKLGNKTFTSTREWIMLRN